MRLLRSTTFQQWLADLKDEKARGIIAARLFRLQQGLQGDVGAISQGISELRIHHGPGYRIYFHRHGSTIIVLLCAGPKSTQSRDIAKAKDILKDWRPNDA